MKKDTIITTMDVKDVPELMESNNTVLPSGPISFPSYAFPDMAAHTTTASSDELSDFEMTRQWSREAFEALYAVDVSEKTEKKQGLTYLSWCWAWSELMKKFPDAEYEIETFGEDKLPYQFDPKTGYMVYTNMTVNGITRRMWLPVMDGANKAMLDKPYKYKVGKPPNVYEKTVEAATMTDVNKTIMRCLVKNMAIFGLGIYIYIGEDLPEPVKQERNAEEIAAEEAENALRAKIAEVIALATELSKDAEKKSKVGAAIKAHNNGKPNPNSIENVEACDAILNDLKAL